MPSHPDRDLLSSLARAASDLLTRRSLHDLEETLAGIVRAAVDTVPGAGAGGISLTENAQLTSRHPTGSVVHILDGIQTELGEGPCITAANRAPEDGLVYVPDLAAPGAQQQWPRFCPAAVERGFRSLLSTPLTLRTSMRAALNLYSAEVDAFDESARTLAGLFGLQAAVLLYGADQASHLSLAVESRDLIGQAKGILMERFDVDDQTAFQMLVRSSQDTNVKLIDVARWLTGNRRESRGRPGAEAHSEVFRGLPRREPVTLRVHRSDHHP